MQRPVREALLVWLGVILSLGVAQLIAFAAPPLRGVVGALAVAAFLYVPMRMLERRGQDVTLAGWRFDRLPQDLAWSLGACAIVLPLFALGFFVFPKWLALLPASARHFLSPYAGGRTLHAIAWDFDLFGAIAGNAAVAFSEEFFYRGYMTLRFEERMSPVRAALLAALCFALGHLLTPAPWRLAVFFPALLFAFLRNRTRTIVGSSICHFLCNVSLLLLERAS
jgi:membrane protease YdiL (CAAX protease family)